MSGTGLFDALLFQYSTPCRHGGVECHHHGLFPWVDGIHKLDFIKTNIHYALKHPEIKEPLAEYLKELVEKRFQ